MATRYGEMLDMIACMAISNGARQKPQKQVYNRANFGEQGATKWRSTSGLR